MLFKNAAIFSIFICFLLTSMQAHAFGRKYSDMQLSADTFIISITATESTSQNKAFSGLLTRAAEVTLKNGYSYFVIIDSQDQSEAKHIYGWFGKSPRKSSKIPHGQITIKCFKEQPQENNIVDAQLFLDKNK